MSTSNPGGNGTTRGTERAVAGAATSARMRIGEILDKGLRPSRDPDRIANRAVDHRREADAGHAWRSAVVEARLLGADSLERLPERTDTRPE